MQGRVFETFESVRPFIPFQNQNIRVPIFYVKYMEVSRCHTFFDELGFCIRLEVGKIARIFVRGCPPGAEPGLTEMSRLGITEKEKYKRPLYIIRKLSPGRVTSTTVQTNSVLSLTLQGSPDSKKMYSRVAFAT